MEDDGLINGLMIMIMIMQLHMCQACVRTDNVCRQSRWPTARCWQREKGREKGEIEMQADSIIAHAYMIVCMTHIASRLRVIQNDSATNNRFSAVAAVQWNGMCSCAECVCDMIPSSPLSYRTDAWARGPLHSFICSCSFAGYQVMMARPITKCCDHSANEQWKLLQSTHCSQVYRLWMLPHIYYLYVSEVRMYVLQIEITLRMFVFIQIALSWPIYLWLAFIASQFGLIDFSFIGNKWRRPFLSVDISNLWMLEPKKRKVEIRFEFIHPSANVELQTRAHRFKYYALNEIPQFGIIARHKNKHGRREWEKVKPVSRIHLLAITICLFIYISYMQFCMR